MSEENQSQSVANREENASSFSWSAGFAIALLAFAGGYLLRDFNAPAATSQPAGLFAWWQNATAEKVEETDLQDFWRIWQLMDEKFVASQSESITPEDKINGAIKGLVESYGDPYSMYFTPEEAKKFGETISGNFGGVGMEVGVRNGLITVIAPLADTPAEQAGILAGDVVISIDDKSTETISLDEAVNLIRGEKGTDVKLVLYREGHNDFLEKSVTRDTISIPTISTEQQGDVFILSIHSFNALVEAKMADAMNEFYASNATKLIIDLRGNPGGYLESAVNMTGYFLPAGKVVVREDFGGEREEEIYRSNGAFINSDTPEKLVILVDGGSASASEIFAGALREHEIATLVGMQTFGKGSVQELVDLPNDASLKVTIAQWLTPNGISISENGLAPDVEVGITAEEMLAGKDVQLEKAIEIAKQL